MISVQTARVRALTMLGVGALLPPASWAQVQVIPSPPGYTGNNFGAALAVVADGDGDGVDDLVIGAPVHQWIASPRPAGRVFVISGASGQIRLTLQRPTEKVPPEGRSYFGASVADAPDLNGDGVADLVIGAPTEEPSGSPESAGRVHVFSGATGAHLYSLISPDKGWACNFGSTVAGLPDIDGDGFGDFVAAHNGVFCVRAHVFSGATGAHLRAIQSPYIGAGFGISMSAVADTDGDGRADILVGADSDRGPEDPPGFGIAFIFSSQTGQVLRTIRSPNSPHYWFGISSNGMGDLDGDGLGDVVVGERSALPGFPSGAGSVHVYSGATGALIRSLGSPEPEPDGAFTTVGRLPDLDGDGRDDFAVGAQYETLNSPPLQHQRGTVHVFSGATGRYLRSIVSPDPEASLVFGLFPAVGAVHHAGPRRATVYITSPYEGPGRIGLVYGFAFCRADTDADGRITSRDISHFLEGWLMTRTAQPPILPPPGVHTGDINGDETVNTADISAFLGLWLDAVMNAGCP